MVFDWSFYGSLIGHSMVFDWSFYGSLIGHSMVFDWSFYGSRLVILWVFDCELIIELSYLCMCMSVLKTGATLCGWLRPLNIRCGQPRWLSGLRRSRVHSLMIARRSLCPEKLGSNPGQGSKGINFSGWHGLDMSITVTKRR